MMVYCGSMYETENKNEIIFGQIGALNSYFEEIPLNQSTFGMQLINCFYLQHAFCDNSKLVVLMTTILMTDQQIKQYVDNIFNKYDKDRSYTLDLQELSEFINDLLLARGSITLANAQQINNSMRALNPHGGDEMTKQTLYTTIQKFNGSVDDISVALLQTLQAPEAYLSHNLKITKSYIPSQNENQNSQNKDIYFQTQKNPQSINQVIGQPQIFRTPSKCDLVNYPQTNIVHPRNQQFQYQSYPANYMHKQQQSQQNQNYIQRTAASYGIGMQPSYGYQRQNLYNYNTTYNGAQRNYSTNNYGIGSYKTGINNYGVVGNSFGGGLGSYQSNSGMNNAVGGAPMPPFNPLAALSFF